MIAFTLEPDALSMTGNMKKYKISGAQADVTMTLSLGNSVSNDPLLVRIYSPDADGHIEVDLKEIVESYLETSLQDADEPYQQTSLVRVFTTQFSTTPPGASSAETLTDTFTAIRAGVDKLSDTPYNFLRQNFLTWQPNVKGVTYSTPEFLTYYNADQAYDVVVKCGEITKNPTTGYDIRKGVPMSDGTQSQTPITLKTIPAGQAWTIPVQYAVIAGLTEGLPKYYDVWVETSLGARLTYVQRYFAQDMKSEQEEWVLFVNSLGGIDTFRAYGESALTAKHTHNVAEIEEVSEEYRVDTERTYKKNTGRLSWKERIWLLDFFPARQKYLYYGQAVRRIVVTESEASYKASELPSAYTFTYRYAEAKPYLNIPRVDVPLDVLNIEVPEVGSFTVAPRLVEFPRTSLSSGALFPVQDPYSEDWGTTTLGAILEAVGAAGLADAASKEWVVGVINTALDEYYNKTASDARYVQTGWFDELFQLYSGNTKQDVNGQLPVDRSQLNIKSMFGFWTEKYISALGRNDDQGGGSVQALGDLSDVALTQSSYSEGQVLKLHYDSVNSEWKWINAADEGGMSVDAMWAALATNDNTKIINASHLPIATASALGVVKVGTTLSVDQYGLLNLPTFGTAGTYFKVTVDQYGRVSTGVASLEAADIPSLDAAKITTGTFDAARIPNIENLNHFSTKVYDASASRTANYVLAAPNGSNGAAVFRALVAADIPNLSWNKITSDKPDTLSGYGITDAKIENGVITLGNATITPITRVEMTVPTGFSITGSPISKTGTLALSYASGYEGFTTELKNKINLLYSLFTREGSGTSADPYIIKANYGLYTEQFLSALGLNGQQGGGSVQALGDLSDVTLTNPQSGQVLKYNGSVWVNANDEGSSTLAWSQITGKPTTISGYGITDAYISNGTIYLGSVSITPLTSFTETDPTVPAWAKAVSKPTYNLDEVLDGNTRKLADYLLKTGGTISDTNSDYALQITDHSLVFKYNGTTYGSITLNNGADIEFDISSGTTIGGDAIATQNWVGQYYLPLTAGSTKALTGDLYINGNSAAGAVIRLISSANFANNLYFGANGTAHWSLGSRASNDNNYFGLWNANTQAWPFSVSYTNNVVTLSTGLVTPYIQIGDIKIVYEQGNNALKVIKSDGTAANFYATGGVSALGYSAGGSGGGGGASYLNDLQDVVITSAAANNILQYNGTNWVNVALGTAMANYATQAWVNTQLGSYLLKSGGTMNGVLTNTMWIEVVDNSYHYGTFIHGGELRVSKGTGLETSIDGGTVTANSFVKRNGTSSQFLKADGSVDSSTYLTSVAFSNLTSHPTTISGYGITDAKIENGTITLGSATITPLTSSVLSGYLPLSGDTMTGSIEFPADKGVRFDTDSSIKVNDSDSFLHINGYLATVFGINDGTNVTERMRLTASGLQVTNGLGVGTAPANGYAIDADGAIRGTSMYINTNAVRHAGDTYISSGTIYIGGSSITPITSQYSLPLAASGTRGGVQIGFTTNAANRNYAVQLSSEKMYVNVPWENTTYSQGTGISISGTTIAIASAYQTNISHGETAYGWGNHATAGYASASALSGYLPLTAGSGNELTGHLYLHESLRMRYIDGSSYVSLYNDGNVLKMTKNQGASSNVSTVTIIDSSNWSSYIGTNANHVGYADHAGEAGYATSAGSAPASDVYSWAKASTKPSYNLDEVSDGSTRKLSNYLPLTGGTMTGAITMGNGNGGIAQGSLTTSPISGYNAPSLGSRAIGIYTKYGNGPDEGALIVSEDTCVIYNSSDTGWSFQIHDKDISTDMSGDTTRVFGIIGAQTAAGHYVWSAAGYQKSGATNSDVLLGGGGHAAISGLSVSYATTAGSATDNTKLPLAAGSSNPLTDDLYMNGNKVRFESGTSGNVMSAYTSSTIFSIGKTVGQTSDTSVSVEYNKITLTDSVNDFDQGWITNECVITPTGITIGGNSVIHSGNIGSQSVNYASIAGYTASMGTFVFNANTLPNSFPLGISTGFVDINSGFGSYGTVLTVRAYGGGGGTLQIYAPYSNTYGGSRMKARFGNYAVSSGNSWTDLKTVAWTEDLASYLPLAGGTMTGELKAFAKAYFGYGTGVSSINSNTYAIYVGTQSARNNSSGSYYGGIAFNHMMNYNNNLYINSPQGWIGLRLYDTPGSERSFLVFATKEGTGITDAGTDIPTERMCIDPWGRVGIGTQSPLSSYKLHVEGNIYANGSIANSGSLSCGQLSCSSFSAEAASMVSGSITATSFVKNGGTSSQFLKADGSVDSTSYFPTSGGTISSSSSDFSLGIAENGLTFKYNTTEKGSLRLVQNSGDYDLQINGYDVIHSGNIGSQNVAYATSAGSAPASDVSAWAKAATKPSYNFGEIGYGAATIGDGANYILFRLSGTWHTGMYHHRTGDEAFVFANENARTSWIFANTNPIDRADWTELTPYMQIKKGCVYINSLIGNGVTPSYNLYVNGTANVTGNLTTDGSFCLTQTAGTGAGISLYGGVGYVSTYGIMFAKTSSFGTLGSNFGVNGDWATYFTMSDNNNRGWIFRRNTSNVAAINGKGCLYLSSNVSTSYFLCMYPNYDTSHNSALIFYNTLIFDGNVYAWGAVAADDGFSDLSDIRQKNVIDYNAEPNFEAVANAPAIRFRWNELSKARDKANPRVGSIAQYWQSILPEAIRQTDDGYLSMQYDVIALLAAISVAKRVTEHERRIESLERENAMLKMEINSLKAA